MTLTVQCVCIVTTTVVVIGSPASAVPVLASNYHSPRWTAFQRPSGGLSHVPFLALKVLGLQGASVQHGHFTPTCNVTRSPSPQSSNTPSGRMDEARWLGVPYLRGCP
jgi:hypothetical protein